jgi:predicted Zn finger-like uncharacterized protein
MTLASTQNTMVTRCPKCNTAFRITAAQLESAKGAVRCGSCLHVFKAQSHLVTKPVAAQANHAAPVTQPAKPESSIASIAKTIASPTKPANNPVKAEPAKATTKPAVAPKADTTKEAVKKVSTQPEPSKAAAKTSSAPKPAVKKPLSKLHDDDDLLISDDMEDKAGGKSRYEFDGFMEMDLETKIKANSLFDRKIKDDKKSVKDNSDESWAANLIDDDDIPQIGIIKSQPTAVPQASKQQQKNNLVFNLVDAGKSDSDEALDDKNFASNMSAVDDFVLSEELSRFPNTKSQQDSIAEEKEEIINAIPVAGIFHDDDFDDSANKRQLKIEPKIRSYDGSRAGLLKNIIPAPLEFTANNISYWYHKMLWPVLVLLGLLGIVLQLAYFRFDHYARIQPYRDFYAFACPIVGCTLPTLIDRKQIVTYNLVVQAHNEAEDALLVDVMLLNKAGFEQPFPDLLLSFSDMDDVVKASRRFAPDDYLGGELAGKKLMPSKQPIHITLEIKDPKVDNYKMDVL